MFPTAIQPGLFLATGTKEGRSPLGSSNLLLRFDEAKRGFYVTLTAGKHRVALKWHQGDKLATTINDPIVAAIPGN